MKTRLSLKEFIRRAILIHGYKYDYSKSIYTGYFDKITIICPIHGDFEQIVADHLGGHGCKKCMFDKLNLLRRSNIDMFIKKAVAVHGNTYNYSDFIYKNSQTKGCIICHEHGKFWQAPNTHLSGKGCPKCYYKKVSLRCKSNIEEFIVKAYKIHNCKYNYDLFIYDGKNVKGKIKCNVCNTIFEQSPDSHLQGKGCPRCKKSKGELAIIDILDKHDIDFKDEHKIPEVADNYRYDFYLPDYRTLIEFHGRQHYENNNFFNRSNEDFLNSKEVDDVKRYSARLFKYKLLEFNYKQLKELTKEQFEELVINTIATGFMIYKQLNKSS